MSGIIVSMEKTTLYLPTELHRAVREAAEREGRSQADVIRAALQAYLAERPRPRPTSIGLGRDPALSGREAEGWLERRWRGAGRRR